MDGRATSQVFIMIRLPLWFFILFSPAASFHDSEESRHGFFVKPLERSIDETNATNRAVSIEKKQSLAGGRYVTATDIRPILELGNDLVAINNTHNFDEIESIYRKGNAGISSNSDTNR
jgi:hypothetical protein